MTDAKTWKARAIQAAHVGDRLKAERDAALAVLTWLTDVTRSLERPRRKVMGDKLERDFGVAHGDFAERPFPPARLRLDGREYALDPDPGNARRGIEVVPASTARCPACAHNDHALDEMRRRCDELREENASLKARLAAIAQGLVKLLDQQL